VRIAFLNPSGKLGGAETSLREILGSLRLGQPDWELWLVLGEDGPLAPIARDLGVRVLVDPFSPALGHMGDAGRRGSWLRLAKAAPTTHRYIRGLARSLREIKPDLIHTNGFKMHLLGAWARPPQTPLVWHIHDYVSSRRMVSRLLRLSGRGCQAAIVNSKSVGSDLRSLFPGLLIQPLYNAINLRRFSPTGNKIDLDNAAGLEKAPFGTVRVGLVGTFARWKGHQVFLEALAGLPPDVPVRGYIIGGPIYQTQGSQWSLAELRQKARELGLAGRIGFTGFLEDSPAVMRSLDIVVHASTAPEPFGMVIIEGMACGKAVVVSQSGGAVELFTPEHDALSHSPGDSAQLTSQIARLARDPGLRERLGAAGRATAEERFDARQLSQQLVELYLKAAPYCRVQSELSAAQLQ